jgi:FkbM family methyltransferase
MKNLINRVLGLAGKQIRSVNAPLHTFEAGLRELKRRTPIGSVIDIGVAEGTPELYGVFKGYPMLLVEANPEYTELLDTLAAQLPARVEKVFCGAQEGIVKLYKNGRKASSLHYANRPEAAQVDVRVMPLDSLTRNLPAPYLVKIDVEGAEMEVLKGAQETLKNSAAVVVETSVAKQYEGGSELADVVAYMKDRGFSVYDMVEGAIIEGRLMQVDLIFVPTDAPFRKL